MKNTTIERLEEILKNEQVTISELSKKTRFPEWFILDIVETYEEGEINSVIHRIGCVFNGDKRGQVWCYLLGHSYDYDENGELQPIEDQ